MSALLRDIFTIPESTATSDYVLRLTESVDTAHLDRTLSDYVVTPQIARAFGTALSVVADAISRNTSRGAFLTGSFGSGKSHFMAVLYALLGHNPHARALPDLAAPIAHHDPQLQNRRVLPLTFHLLGAESLEQALFDGYLRQVRELHPGAALPPLHETSRLLEDADRMRTRMGDDAFFAGLNEGAGSDDVWGQVLGDSGTWTPESYEAARAASPSDRRRSELVSALTEHYFSGYTRHADYVSLDEGLTAISAHAQSLGYDAVVLFLDELVLWLAFRIRDHQFFGTETQKITKLVEGGQGGRRIPLVSFIARQMDLRRWLADSGASGAEQQALDQAFRFQEGRFTQIALGDDNLPYVANKRLLTPRSAEASAEIDRAFERLDRRGEAWDVLLDGMNTDDRHRGADANQFRLTYPFSPALVSTLRSLAGVMQRERTALKVMQQMLVDQRDSITIDDVLPVGDAFDYLVTGAAGDQPLDEASAALFRASNSLYRERLLPTILANHNLTETDLADGAMTPGLAGDLRLAKTLLLSAVAPNVPALKALTASRLASLNHGSIRTPLPGGESSVVLSKVRAWATRVPEIHVENQGRNPLISVQLSDVDYESVVDRARGEDNDGRRRELVKRLVAEGFGVDDLGTPDMTGTYSHPLVWRGSTRRVDLVFGNVRDAGWLSDEHFHASPGTWRFVIDHPFDEPGHTPSEDVSRIDGMRARGWNENTIVWLPRFFSDDRIRDISRLVILNFLLEGTGERYARYADHLSETGRVQARSILEAQREALLHTLRRAIQVAYDVESPQRADDVVGDHPDVLLSLTPSFTPRPPAGGTLRQAFDALVSDAFAATYPLHPRFEPGDEALRVRDLTDVYTYVEQALADKEKRIPLGSDANVVRRIANPLGVGRAAETHFLMGDNYFSPWGTEFERRLGARDSDGRGPLTAGDVRRWITEMQPAYGLAREVQDLVILAWAALRQRAWYAMGASIEAPKPGAVRDEYELREQELPDPEMWTRATRIAGGFFGVHAATYVTPAEVARFAAAVHEHAVTQVDAAHRLVSELDRVRARLGFGSDPSARVTTARAAAELCDALRGLHGLPLITRLAQCDLGEPQRAGRSLATAEEIAKDLRAYEWGRFDPLLTAAKQDDETGGRAAAILTGLREAFAADELSQPLIEARRKAEEELFAWLTAQTQAPPAPTPPAPGPVPRASGRARIRRGQGPERVAADLRRFVDEHADSDVVVEWRVE